MVKVSKRTAIELIRVILKNSLGFAPPWSDIRIVSCSDDLGYIEFYVGVSHYKFVHVPNVGRSVKLISSDPSIVFEGKF